jgi:hypothetical protein
VIDTIRKRHGKPRRRQDSSGIGRAVLGVPSLARLDAMWVLRIMSWFLIVVALLAVGPILTLAFGPAKLDAQWSTATHRPTGQAPDPATHREAIIQVYAGRAFNWRGAFAVHTWLAAKPAGAARYTRYEVIGWNAMRGGSAVSVSDHRAPDAEWFGARPELLRELRGDAAEAIIARLPAVVAGYAYPSTYSAWPGPNSNTFLAHLGRELPELRLTLPPTAIGKDYLPGGRLFARTPSGTGFQLSWNGIVGVLAAADEGFELNILGLVTGFDLKRPALKVPGIGRVPAT